jgi:EpsI family protein
VGVRLTEDGRNPAELPSFIGTEWIGRRVDVTAMEQEILPADTGYSRKNYVSLASVDRQVFVSIVLSGRDRTSIHRPELCLVGQGWTIAARSSYEFTVGGSTVPATLLRVEHAGVDVQGRPVKLVAFFAYWFVGGSSLEPTHQGMLWRDVRNRLTHFQSDRWAYVVVQSVLTTGGEQAAFARMQEIVAGTWPVIRTETQPP